MRTLLILFALTLACLTANARLRCQGFNNADNKVTIVFTDDKAGSNYKVTDAELLNLGKKYTATSIKTTIEKGTATVTLTFPHLTLFSNPKVTLRINGKKKGFKVCQ